MHKETYYPITQIYLMLKKLWLQGVAKCLMVVALLVGSHLNAGAFTGSDLASGQKYYLFNIYQSKFLGADNKLQAPNIGTPVAFTASATGFTIDGTTYTATKNDAGYYQLKNGSNFYAFEDKVADTENPDDENRAMYMGGGVTCQNTTNDTDRSYWQLISETEYAEWQAKKKFTVASLNVDGMPASVKVYNIYTVNLNPDATGADGATAIGNRLRASGFDVVGVSEDFDYHNQLWNAAWNNGQDVHYNAGTHRGKLQDAANAAGVLSKYLGKNPIIDSDGLCFFYRVGIVDQSTIESSETFVQWNDHYGYDDHGADGLIKKGYRFYVVKLADGTEVDVYSMHMDAESSAEDNAARAKQLTQLANAIKATNNKRPIIIIGDSNCRYTRDKVKSNLIDAINADERFTIRDPWIQYGRDGKYPAYPSSSIMASTEGYLSGEVVDKIWYVNNTESNIRIVAETYAQDLSFVDEAGSPLCDHKPCVVTFSYHEYDAAIDDQPVDEKEDDSAVYLRNRGTGRFLKSGGAWGTHSIVGNYPIDFNLESNNGKYALRCEAGYVSCEGDNVQTFVDGPDGEARSVKDWELIEQDGFYVFAHNGRALSANDPYFFNDDPNYRWVILDALNPTDKLQQWEVLTKDQMMEELNKANKTNPVNASWLMGNPNFDRNLTTAKWNNNISSSATRMTSNLADGKNDGTADDNFVAEAYVNTTNSWSTPSTTWDINQTITNIPNGWYRVSAQAFQRISNSNTTTATIQLYANNEAQQVELMYNLKKETTNAIGSKKDGNYYYPNNMSEASQYFLKGYYQNSVWVNVTDGSLKVGIRKTSDTGKSNTAWCCFDNFQLYYFGDEKPAEAFGANVIAETRKAEMVDGALTLSGTWREADMAELSTKISENPSLLLDATNATLVAQPEVVTVNAPANMMIKVADAADVANTQNVIANGKCANFVLTDKADFAPQQTFTATATHYTRTNTQGLNTVCMPFDLKATDFPEGCTVYTYSGQSEGTAYFEEANGEITAGTPILVDDKTTETGNNAKWEMMLANRNVIAEVGGNTAAGEAEGLNGAFVNRELGENYFKLNSAGTKFVKSTSTSTISPFRFYLKEDATSEVKSIMLSLDGVETSLDEVINDPMTKIESYDLNGRKILTITRPGLYIKNGKKVVVK